MKIFVILTVISVISFQSNGQFSISGEYRPRTEYDHGYKNLASEGEEALIWTRQRTRLNFNFKNEFMESKLVLQDVRTWGSQPQLNISDHLSSLHEAWARVKFNNMFSMKAGRQELVYDDHRIFGSVGWAHQARSHDVVVFEFKKEKLFQADMGIAYNQNQAPADSFMVANNYKAMQYLWLNRDFGKRVKLSLLFLNNGVQYSTLNQSGTDWGHGIIYSQTLGSRLGITQLGPLEFFIAGYYQMGKDAANVDLEAFYGAFDAGVSLLADDKLKFHAGLEILSGTDQTGTSATNRSFTPFYGTNHKFNGHMDYFYVGNHINSVGLNDYYFKCSFQFNKLTPGIDVHVFQSNAEVADPVDPKKAMAPGLGTGFDFHMGFKMNSTVSFKAGYSQMFATETMEALKGGSKDAINQWGWLMMSVTPTFFQSNN